MPILNVELAGAARYSWLLLLMVISLAGVLLMAVTLSSSSIPLCVPSVAPTVIPPVKVLVPPNFSRPPLTPVEAAAFHVPPPRKVSAAEPVMAVVMLMVLPMPVVVPAPVSMLLLPLPALMLIVLAPDPWVFCRVSLAVLVAKLDRMTFEFVPTVAPLSVSTPGVVGELLPMMSALVRDEETEIAPVAYAPPAVSIWIPTPVVAEVGLALNCATAAAPGTTPPVQLAGVSHALPVGDDQMTWASALLVVSATNAVNIDSALFINELCFVVIRVIFCLYYTVFYTIHLNVAILTGNNMEQFTHSKIVHFVGI